MDKVMKEFDNSSFYNKKTDTLVLKETTVSEIKSFIKQKLIEARKEVLKEAQDFLHGWPSHEDMDKKNALIEIDEYLIGELEKLNQLSKEEGK